MNFSPQKNRRKNTKDTSFHIGATNFIFIYLFFFLMNLILNFSLEKKFIDLSRDFITDMEQQNKKRASAM